MVPSEAWQFIISRVRCARNSPDTVFLLEGLGGSWDATDRLLGEGGMQWAYSELFQNYSGPAVANYLDHCIDAGRRLGVLVNYSETHDNERLAAKGRTWSLMRNRLAALTAQSGAWGYTCGVEWLADEKLEVHQARGLNWGANGNIVGELARLARLTSDHPCFFDGAALERLSAPDSAVLALARTSADGVDRVLVLVNTDCERELKTTLPQARWNECGEPTLDLLGQQFPAVASGAEITIHYLRAGRTPTVRRPCPSHCKIAARGYLYPLEARAGRVGLRHAARGRARRVPRPMRLARARRLGRRGPRALPGRHRPPRPAAGAPGAGRGAAGRLRAQRHARRWRRWGLPAISAW